MLLLTFLPLLFALVEIRAAVFKLDPESLTVTKYDKRYLSSISASSFNYNQTHKAYNFSFTALEDLPMDLKAAAQIYKFAAKAYRLINIPLVPELNMCELFEKDEFGVHILYNYSNFRGCPVKKNVNYEFVNYNLDDDKLPPTLIPGKYKMNMQMLSNSKKVTYAELEWRVTVLFAKH